ncbi:MAG: hypothetical protein ACKVU2_00810 [Saprospiraceae bacterium]
MTETLSPQTLKSALAELARSDRAFLVALLTEVLESAYPSGAESPAKLSLKGRKPLPTKITPAYRPKDVAKWRKQFAAPASVLLELRPLFADAPPTEEMVRGLKR